MTVTHDMLLAMRRGAAELGALRTAVRDFVLASRTPDGAFRGRGESSDLYYTVFALDLLAALDADVDREAVAAYLRGFGAGEGLDPIHRICLARCWSRAGHAGAEPAARASLLAALTRGRLPDGGYHTISGAARGSVYGAFLAMLAYEDLGAAPPDPDALIRSVRSLRSADGGVANDAAMPAGAAAAAAGALVVLHRLGQPPDDGIVTWLLAQAFEEGGFLATPGAPMPDLLSTATALYALRTVGVLLPENRREDTALFVDSLWDERGGYRGHWLDSTPDVEYTFYGLLAKGCLAGEIERALERAVQPRKNAEVAENERLVK